MDLAALDFFLYTDWFETNAGNPGAYYLDLRTSKDELRLDAWGKSLLLNGPILKAPIIFLCQDIDHWPRLVVFNYERGTALVLGKGNNAEEFRGDLEWPQWNYLWPKVSATLGWIHDDQKPRVIEANWITVSIYSFHSLT